MLVDIPKELKIEITTGNVRVNLKVLDEEKDKAIATVWLGCIKLGGFRLRESEHPTEDNNLWVAVPAYRSRSGKFHKIFWTDNKELWQLIQDKIFEAYYQALEKIQAKSNEIPVVEE